MKGTYYTIEAVIAILMIVTIFLLLYKTSPPNPEIDVANVKTQIYDGLDNLKSKGSLREQALDNNATGIKNDLDDFLPLNIELDVTIYNQSFNNVTQTHSEQVEDTVSVSYFIAGDVGNYTPKEIRVHAWGFK